MKTFNTQLIVPFIITLLLTGCMPDSLTKFKKDAPAKAATTTTTGGTATSPPVVDSSGVPIVFDPPTYFTYKNLANSATIASMGTAIDIEPLLDGSLGDDAKVDKFLESCSIVTSGVDSQATTLPAGISFNECAFKGTPTSTKSIITPYCSDGVSIDQATCESNPLVWNGTTCSVPDLNYANSTACSAGFHKWYASGDPISYRIKLTYHNSAGVQSSVYTRMNLGVYKTLTSLSYTQADKLLLKVTGSTYLPAVVPLLTTTATVGSYARNNIIVSNTDVSSVAKFVDTTGSFIGVNKLIPIKVASTTPFILNTFITKAGDATTVGKIFKIDSAARILYVENISSNNKYFNKSDLICSNSITGMCGTSYAIVDISDSYIYKAAQNLDNDKQYFSAKFAIDTPINVFEVGTTIKSLLPVSSAEIVSTNAVKFSVSPALPCNDPTDPTDCVSIDATTGAITGTFSSTLSSTEFTLTATNPLGSVNTKVNLSAIVGPTDLSLTNKQIITVSGTSNFREGETLIQPLAPPLTEALKAKIIKIVNNYQMAIETFNGVFVPGASLDNNNSAFQSEKAFIIPYSSCTDTNYTTQATCELASFAWAPPAAVHYNLSVITSNSGGYAVGDYVTSTAGTGTGATGLVVHVQTGARDELFVQHLTQTATSTSTAKTFYEGDTLNSGATVYQVQNGTMKVTLASAASFVKGSDVVSNASSSAYTNAVNGNVLSLSEISKISSGTNFKIGQTLYNHETQLESSANSNITDVTHEVYYVFERGKTMYATGNVATGNGIIYSISPALPAGLYLDTAKGTIYGSATGSSIKKDYLLTATNFIGSTSFVVALEVKDYFEIIEKTGASSALLHKVGDYQINRKCRIDATDIASMSNGKALDLRCFLDMEEEDLFESDLKLNIFTGAGICQYIRYEPYYFYSWQPNYSVNISNKYPKPAIIRSGCTNLTSSGVIPTADKCDGNYATTANPTFPNCDEGNLSYVVETYSQDSNTGACTLASAPDVKTVACGGKKVNCISGAILDTIQKSDLLLGKRNSISSSASGLNSIYNHASPISKGDGYNNLRLANGSVNNQCYSSAADTLTWRNTTRAINNLSSTPFAYDSNPYYTISCLDAAQDVKARIRVVVRDWDKSFNIQSDIFNQSFLTPPANMNNNATDPIFNSPYNDVSDWDDDYNGLASTYTPSTCGVQAAGSCSVIAGKFPSSADCTNAGGTPVAPGTCSDPTYTSYLSCVDSGSCSDGLSLDAGTCGKVPATWTPSTWTPATCTFNNQNQCEYFGGVWTGDEQYKFPDDASGNILGL